MRGGGVRESWARGLGMRWSRETRAGGSRNVVEERESGKGGLGMRQRRESRAKGI